MGGGFRLSAEIEVRQRGGDGVIAALGDWNNGWALYLLDGRPVACVNRFGEPFARGGDAAAGGRDGTPSRSCTGVRRAAAARSRSASTARCSRETRIAGDLPFRWQIGGTGALVGHDRGFPVCDDYRPPAPFSGTIERVVLEPLFMLPADVQAEIEALLKRE